MGICCVAAIAGGAEGQREIGAGGGKLAVCTRARGESKSPGRGSGERAEESVGGEDNRGNGDSSETVARRAGERQWRGWVASKGREGRWEMGRGSVPRGTGLRVLRRPGRNEKGRHGVDGCFSRWFGSGTFCVGN